MKECRARLAMLLLAAHVLVSGAGCSAATAAGMTVGTPTYELEAHTEIKSGIRPYAISEYTYYQVIGGKRQKLWNFVQHDKYAHHWIAPSGRVWVMTDSMPGPGGAGGFWTRDARGSELGGFRYDMVLPPTPYKGGGLMAAGSGKAIDIGRVEAISIGQSGKTDLLRLPLIGGGEGRAMLVTTADGASVGLCRTLAKGEHDLLGEAIKAGTYSSPTVTRPLERSPLIYWKIRDDKKGQERRILQSVLQASNGDPIQDRFSSLSSEQEMRLDASYVARSSAGRVLWFGFPSLGEPDAAELTVMRYDGKVLGRIDLLKETGCASSAEFKAKVAYHDLRIPGEGGWVPLDTVQNYGGNVAERIEMRGENRRYILVVDDSKARLETYRGLEARRPKEGIWPNAKILAERRFDSPNRRFRLRERRVKNPNGSDYFFVTFLGKADDEDGKEKFVELWSNMSYSPLAAVRVFDSGRNFALLSQPGSEGRPDMAVMLVRNAEGYQMGGIDLSQPPASFKSAKEALAKLRLAEMTAKPEGPSLAKEFEGVTYRAPVAETFRLPLGPNRVWEFRLGPTAYGPQGEGMMWSTPPAGAQ